MGLKNFLTDIFCGVTDDQIVDPTEKYLETAPEPEGFTVLEVPKPWHKNIQRCPYDKNVYGSAAWWHERDMERRVASGIAGSSRGNADILYGGFGDD
ncbi:MAG: hypothetical protein RBT64_12125 [Trichloromonas sp.]|jgi:hypothetical protein|nr:hypothetical protein [Trichloromonas sp.]